MSENQSFVLDKETITRIQLIAEKKGIDLGKVLESLSLDKRNKVSSSFLLGKDYQTLTLSEVNNIATVLNVNPFIFYSTDNSVDAETKSIQFRKVIAERIYASRMAKGWTTNDIADMAAVSRSTVVNLEEGKEVHLDLLLRVAFILEIRPYELFLFKEDLQVFESLRQELIEIGKQPNVTSQLIEDISQTEQEFQQFKRSELWLEEWKPQSKRTKESAKRREFKQTVEKSGENFVGVVGVAGILGAVFLAPTIGVSMAIGGPLLLSLIKNRQHAFKK